ncbi:MAG: carboxypeptidase-like regulatory domain-containing protein [Chloroflexota bacterium]
MSFNHQEYNNRYVQNARNGGAPINDARQKYGVRIKEASVAEGETYWKVIGVHHLEPRENFGNHHVYMEALDEEGNRVKNPPAWVEWTWQGRRPDERADPVILDKPVAEAGGNLSMHFGQIVSIKVKGTNRDGQDKSDWAENMHTAHPDERLGDGSLLNSIGHHSFYVVFQRTRKGTVMNDGVIKGRVERGQNQLVRLYQGDDVLSQQRLGSDLAFQFDGLSAGAYRVVVVGTNIQHDNIALNASNKEVSISLALPPPTDSSISGTVRNGQGKQLFLVKEGNIILRLALGADGRYRFENLPAGIYSVQVFETAIKQDNISLDGTNSREVNLAIPDPTGPEIPETGTKTIDHYLLFGPPSTRGRQTNLLLATDYILAFSPTVGFNVEEAKLARQVTIIGEGVSQANQQAIQSSGSDVELLSGDAYDIEAQLNARIQTGRAFGS